MSELTPVSAATLEVTDALTFENVSIYAEKLTDLLSSGQSLLVDLSGCTGIDLAGAQLLISAAKTAEENGVSLSYTGAHRYLRICDYAGLKPKGAEQQ